MKNNNKYMDATQIQKELILNIENPIIFDAGAWFGDTIADYQRVFNDATFYAFEPHPFSFSFLKEKKTYHYINDDKVNVFNLALGDENKEVIFFTNLEPQTNSLLQPDPLAEKTWECKACENVGNEVVTMCTIDKFVEENEIDHIDILKLDTQGSEHLILRGAQETIKKNKIKIIYSEILIMPAYFGQIHIDELLYEFRKNDFELYNFYGINTDNRRCKQCDAIFIHKSYLEQNEQLRFK